MLISLSLDDITKTISAIAMEPTESLKTIVFPEAELNHENAQGPLKGSESELETNKHRELAASFIRTILYFDVFNYPLTQKEIFTFCDRKIKDHETASRILQDLCDKNLLRQEEGFFFTGGSMKVLSRIKGNALAKKRMKTARFYASVIAIFPFVRGVYISGSLSKNFMADNSDIDFFILAEPGRLWLCRFLLVLFKRFILFNSHRNFCINYMLDTNNLEIEQRDIYTATETLMLIPVFNIKLFDKFLAANNWWKAFYPNYQVPSGAERNRNHIIKSFLEFIFSSWIGTKLDDLSYKIFTNYWKQKHKNIQSANTDRQVCSDKSVAACFPHDQHYRIINVYQQKIKEFEAATGMVINYTKRIQPARKIA